MRYAVFTDIHANLEALEAVLAKIDELAKDEPIDQIWFLGDLVGYGPNPNECITRLRERTDVIIAGNHDWAAVGKLDLEDFSAAARISAEWTMKQLTEEHRTFLANLPERLEIGECTLVHGSPYGPLWEYLTSEALAERSFQHFNSRLCFVGHTHVPVIFQQPDSIANAPTSPLEEAAQNGTVHTLPTDDIPVEEDSEAQTESSEEAADMATIAATQHATKASGQAESAYANPGTGQPMSESDANNVLEQHATDTDTEQIPEQTPEIPEDAEETGNDREEASLAETTENAELSNDEDGANNEDTPVIIVESEQEDSRTEDDEDDENAEGDEEDNVQETEDSLNSEIEELLELLGLSESMIQVTNEMLEPPEGHWELAEGYRAIVNPGGVGQPRDGDPRAAFMIYDTERGFTFYRIPYDIRQTQEKILKAGLPQYLAVRLAYGR